LFPHKKISQTGDFREPILGEDTHFFFATSLATTSLLLAFNFPSSYASFKDMNMGKFLIPERMVKIKTVLEGFEFNL